MDDKPLKDWILESIPETVMEIVQTMLFVDVQPAHGVAKPADVLHVPARAEASAIVGLNGGLEGGVRVGCSTHVALFLSSALAGDSFSVLKGEAVDAFAEIGNMISGGISTRLSKRVGDISLTPPSVIVGKDYEVDYTRLLESVRFFFRAQGEPFYIEVHYRNPKDLHKINAIFEEGTLARLDTWALKRKASRDQAIIMLLDQYDKK
ncbi:MAG: chemotaxis protein CheX [Magnetococcales bacterium]|nr:chemotaxis protein CheX [Magnetococcales bacterium]